MKKQIVLIGIFLWVIIIGFTGCINTNSNNEQGQYRFTESFTEEYPVNEQTSVRVSTTNGNIHVVGWDGSVIKLSGLKKAHRQDELENIELQVKLDSNLISFNVSHKTGLWRSEAIDLDLMVPYTTVIEQIDSTNGEVNIREMSVALISTTNGAITIHVSEIDNSVMLLSTNGNIEVQLSSTLNAIFDIKTTNGEIRLNDVPIVITIDTPTYKLGSIGKNGHFIDIETVNGDIELNTLV